MLTVFGESCKLIVSMSLLSEIENEAFQRYDKQLADSIVSGYEKLLKRTNLPDYRLTFQNKRMLIQYRHKAFQKTIPVSYDGSNYFVNKKPVQFDQIEETIVFELDKKNKG